MDLEMCFDVSEFKEYQVALSESRAQVIGPQNGKENMDLRTCTSEMTVS